jgi:hypothetical protein
MFLQIPDALRACVCPRERLVEVFKEGGNTVAALEEHCPRGYRSYLECVYVCMCVYLLMYVRVCV